MDYAANTASSSNINVVLPRTFAAAPARNQYLRRIGLASTALTALLLSLTLSGLTIAASPVHEQSTEGPWAKGRILVMPRAGLSATEFAKILGAHGGRPTRKLGNLDIHVIELPPNASEKAVAKLLSKHPHIKFAEPDQLVAPDLSANDIYYGSAWHLQMVQAPAAWDYSLGDGVTVAILDTGVDANHPDLQGQLVPGWNFWNNNSDTADVHGHGTLVAGVVAAGGNNSIGVTSMAWNSKLMPIRISDVNGYGSLSAIASGLSWAADRGAKVANISYMVHSSSTVQSAAQYMRNKGGVVVNSAGNTGGFDATAASDSLISVSATDSSDTRAGWATYGSHVDFSAPGVDIWSTAAGGGYGAVSGTSFSSPVTVSVVALMMAANPALSPSQIVDLLKSTAIDLGSPGYDQYYGYGRVSAAAAVQAAVQGRGTSDTELPVVAISSPTGGTVAGIAPVNVSASDNVGVTRVELLVNGALIANDTSTPYAFSWDSTQVADGGATLVVRAYDAAGNSRTSTAVQVSVANTTVTPTPVTPLPNDVIPPTVSISNPADGSKVNGQVTIKAISSDNVGIANLSLYVDGVMSATGNVATTSYKWNANKAARGAHTISAVAIDTAGNQTTAAIRVIK